MFMNEKIMLFGMLVILPVISCAMEREVAIKYEDPAIVVAFCRNNRRKSYEDRSFYFYNEERGHVFGLADGHSGSRTAELIAKEFDSLFANQKNSDVCANLSQALLAADNKVKNFCDGSTAVVVNIVTNKDCGQGDSVKCYFANVGDSRAVLGRIAPEGKYTISFCTQDHKPEGNEFERVLAAGGCVSDAGYVYSSEDSKKGVAMTRSIGDYDRDPEKKVIIATPECTTHDISGASEYVLVLGSDGLWDYDEDSLSEHKFSEYAFSTISRGIADGNSLIEIAKKMVTDALREDSADDITCMIVKIKALMENKKATMQEEKIVRQGPVFSSSW